MFTRQHLSFLLSALAVLVCTFILIRLPLFNYLGYEFSAASALIIPFFLGPLTIKAFRRLAKEQQTSSTLFISTLKESGRYGFLLLAIPFITATVNMYVVKNCSYGEGLLFFFLIPVITAIWSISLAFVCAALFRRARLVYFFLLIVNLLYPAYLGYFTPAIYSYNFIYGYFPGFSYDEILRISPALLLFRGITVVCSLFFFLCSNVILNIAPVDASFLTKVRALAGSIKINTSYSLIFLLLIILLFSWFFRFTLGFESSDQLIEETLSAKYETEHFTIRYTPGSFTKDEIAFAGEEHEFRFAQDEQALNLKFPTKITSFIYPDEETKHRFIGTGTTNIAKPWRNEIHINKSDWQEVLKHELVHVLAGSFGLPIIHAHYNVGLTEGLAVAIDGDWGNRTLHEYAAAIKKFGIVSHPENLISAQGFMTQGSGVSYVLMGSFCKFLIERNGIETFKYLYGGYGVQTVYNTTYAELVKEWQAEIDHIQVPESWRNHVEYYFSRPSIFAKECARTIARLNEDGYIALGKNDIQTAKQTFRTSLLGSWNSEALGGLLRADYLAGQYDSVVLTVNEQLHDSTRQAGAASLMLLYGNSLWMQGDTASARSVFNQVLATDLSDAYD